MTLRVCVVGVGPRGASLLERICANAPEFGRSVVVHLVERGEAGPGAVWRRDQAPHLLMNTVACQITGFVDDSVRCAGPIVKGPTLYEWAKQLAEGLIPGDHPEAVVEEARALGPDDYPTRAFHGHYLAWFVELTVACAPGLVTVHTHTGEAVALDDCVDGQVVTLADGTRLGGLDGVALALGHGDLMASESEARLAAFAERNDLLFLPPGNPADCTLDEIEPGMPIAVLGLGLAFFDHLALLTLGRGGAFTRTAGGLAYRPSGREPILHVGSRRGIPYHARGANQKGAHGRHAARFLTPSVIAALRSRAVAGAPVTFRDDIWPLLDMEVRSVYYEKLIGGQAGRRFVTRYVDGEPESDLLDAFEIPPRLRWNWERLARPQGDRRFADRGQFTDWLLTHLRADVRQARQGNVDGPLKAALDVLRDLRNEIRLVVDHGGITGASYRDELEGWYAPLNAYLSMGPPAHRIEELIALIEAGVVRPLGARTTVRPGDGVFLAESAEVPGGPVAVRGVIAARLPETDVRRSANPLLRHLVDGGAGAPYRIGDYETGALAVSERPYHVLDRAGAPHPARFAFGIPLEGAHWVTSAGIRPGVGSVTLEDADAIARALLGVRPAARPRSHPHTT